MDTGCKTLVPVDSEHHVRLMREYRQLLQSTMGPSGGCKAVVTGGGYLEVVSTSAALTARLNVASPLCKFISNLVAGLADHGLYCGVVLSHLLEQQWQQCKFPKSKTMQSITFLVEKLKLFLTSDNVCVKLDFDSVQNFLPLVRTVITSKCPALIAGMDVDKLCLEIIRVFLNCVDEETNLINRIYVKVECGCNTFTSYKGLLYTVTDPHSIEIAKGLAGDIKILVFVLKLEEGNELFPKFDKLKQILELSAELGVKMVACQKTVSSEIKFFLRRKKIILLERMGTDFTKILIDISHAFPISQLNVEDSEIGKLVGHLSSIEPVQFNECDYLALHNTNVPVGTLLVKTSSLLGEDFVKALILQALAALRIVVAHPLLIVGGGCLESWLIGQIHLLKEDRKEEDFRLVSTWVQRALLSACSAVEVDTVYHHGWREEEELCNCRLLQRGEVERGGAAWLTLREVVTSEVSLGQPLQPNMTLRPDVLMECHHQKVQVINTTFEAFANLSDIGLIVLDN